MQQFFCRYDHARMPHFAPDASAAACSFAVDLQEVDPSWRVDTYRIIEVTCQRGAEEDRWFFSVYHRAGPSFEARPGAFG